MDGCRSSCLDCSRTVSHTEHWRTSNPQIPTRATRHYTKIRVMNVNYIISLVQSPSLPPQPQLSNKRWGYSTNNALTTGTSLGVMQSFPDALFSVETVDSARSVCRILRPTRIDGFAEVISHRHVALDPLLVNCPDHIHRTPPPPRWPHMLSRYFLTTFF